MSPRLILASQSAARAAMLGAAGIPFTAMAALADEERIKSELRGQNINAADCAQALAKAKALSLSELYPEVLVLGSDQTLELPDGVMLDKAENLEALTIQLGTLSGRTHKLWSAAVIVRGGAQVWSAVECAQLTMRPLSDAFINSYVVRIGESVTGCVGGYQIEGEGVQLFSHIEGSHFCIMGLPLLPLLAGLRDLGVLIS